MSKKTSLALHFLFAGIVIIELYGRISNNITLEYFAKPLVMIWMAVFFLLFRQKIALTIPVLVAYFFSWAGDIFLMFAGKNELFFYAGVGGFFLAQLTYIFLFLRYSEKGGRGYLQKNGFIVILYLAYVAGMLYLLFPGLDGMMKPIILVYALSLTGMSMMALNRHGRVNYTSFILVFTGSLLFVVSDSMIALNKFFMEFRLAGFWIMLTYMAAQYLIMRGLILEK